MKCAGREAELPAAEKAAYGGKEGWDARNQMHNFLKTEENETAAQHLPVSQLRGGHAIYTGLMQRHDRLRRRGLGE